MLGLLTEKMQGLVSRLSRQGKLTEENISDAVREVRLALLEADVNYGVVKTLIKRIKEKALGADALQKVSAGQQFIKLVHDELVALMGGSEKPLELKGSPAVVLLCGLQGSGKTTHAVKLALYLKKQSRKPLVIACDLQRPAAIEQLKTLAEQAEVGSFALDGEKNPVRVAEQGLTFAREHNYDVVIVDTAGRLHIDEPLMEELQQISAVTAPCEVLFVANATTGQDAVNVASAFNEKMAITGSILTMLDGNTRGGAAIAISEVTGRPLKFEGVGEKIDDLQLFNPSSMADRILGMGDTINLVRKAEEHFDEGQAKQLQKKLRTASFTFMDYLSQIQMVKKMGSFKSLLGMMPGMSNMQALQNLDESHLLKVEAMILSMTPAEREGMSELIPGRRRRIALGSGRPMDEVHKLVKSFKQMKKMMKNMPNMKNLQNMMGGSLWR